jgi:hypothetical protein
MDKFFASLLEKRAYGELLKDHLEGYVEEIVKKKYHILKTSDNFYLYKNDIKRWISSMREDVSWMEEMSVRSRNKVTAADISEKLDQIERGFDGIEHRIANMDKEHSRYIRATVTRLNYLLNQEDNMKGLVIRLLNHLSDAEDQDAAIQETGNFMNLSQVSILSEHALYKKRKPRTVFKETLVADEESVELSAEEILSLNRLKSRYSRKEIESYLDAHSKNGRMEVTEGTVTTAEDFEMLILAYDYSTRRKSIYEVEDLEPELIDNGRYRYPRLVFVRRKEL